MISTKSPPLVVGPELQSIPVNSELKLRKDPMDELTGLHTKQEYFNWLEKEYFRWLQDDEVQSISIVVFDVDGFRRNIYSIGHGNGDKYLTSLAEILSKELQTYKAKAFRLGGDDFATVIVNARIETLRELVRKITAEEKELNVDVSNLAGVVPGGNYENVLTLSAGVTHIKRPFLCDLTKLIENCLAAIQVSKAVRQMNNESMSSLTIEIKIETKEV